MKTLMPSINELLKQSEYVDGIFRLKEDRFHGQETKYRKKSDNQDSVNILVRK